MAPSYALSAWMFTRALALVYFVAFASLSVQVSGLWGSKGVSPIRGYLEAVEKQVSPGGRWQLPTVFWLDATDVSLKTAAIVGAIAALLAFAGVATGWMFLICLVLYLSYVVAGQEFMSFQWDALLVEVGFIALFAVPWSLRPQLLEAVEPHWIVRWAFYGVLFKLMFLSGVVKLLSGDETWRDLSALTVHYWTQPLPNPLSPFMHMLPRWLHQVSTALTFVVELALPFLIFWPRTRLIAAAGFAGLSILILVSGNYTFFNWLTLALCIWLVPDSWWVSITEQLPFTLHETGAPVFPHPLVATAMGALLVLSLIWSTRWFYGDAVMDRLAPVLRFTQIFRISNPYGLFANMTRTRPEIVIEGSSDGRNWKEYEFRYKPGNLYRMPPVVAPHQPRLDWQMWFAALGSFRQNPWLQNLMARIFEGSPEALSLLSWNPFPEEPPRFLRARLYEYRFTSAGEIFNDGKWWTRELIGDYSPTFER